MAAPLERRAPVGECPAGAFRVDVKEKMLPLLRLASSVLELFRAPLSFALVCTFLAASWIITFDWLLLHYGGSRGFSSLSRIADGPALLFFGTLLGSAVAMSGVSYRARTRLAGRESASEVYRDLLERLAALEASIGTTKDLTTIYRALWGFVAASAPCSGLLVSRYDSKEQLRYCVYAHSDGGEEDASALPPMPMTDSPHSRAVATGEVVVCDDRLSGASRRPVVNLGFDRDPRPPRSSIAVPLKVNGVVIGAFEVQSVEVGAYKPEHVIALRMAGDVAAIATMNANHLERERKLRDDLESSEARFRSLVQNSSDMIRLLDAQGMVLYESPSVERILGHRAGSGFDFFETIHADDIVRVRTALLEAVEHGDSEATFRQSHVNGEWRWVESKAVNLLADPHVGAVVLNSRDIHERKVAEKALEEEKDFISSLVDVLPGIFYTFGADGKYVRWNKNFERVSGYSAEELGLMGPQDLIVEEEQPLLQNLIEVANSGDPVTSPLTLRKKSGEKAFYLCTGVKVLTGETSYIAGTGIDLTQQRADQERIERLNSELQERVERLTALYEVDSATNGTHHLPLVLDVFLEQVHKRLGVDAASVLLFDPDSQVLRFAAATGFRTGALRYTTLRLGEGQAGRAALEGSVVHLRDPVAFSAAFSQAPEVGSEGFECYWAVPLFAKGRLQGVLELFSRRRWEPNEDWYQFIKALSNQAASAMHNATLVQNLERSNSELRLAYDTTIEGWARALDLRDEETEGHSRRVTDMGVALARKLGVAEEEIVHIRRGALLHDIGKMAMPDDILLKRGELSAEEWEIMKRHPEYAYKLLAPIKFLLPAIDIPYAHHEKWDGSGYPRGLKGEEIPLAARIFSVVDVYDALTSDRPYRQAWKHDAAISFIQEASGKHFDSKVVDAFVEQIMRVGPRGVIARERNAEA